LVVDLAAQTLLAPRPVALRRRALPAGPRSEVARQRLERAEHALADERGERRAADLGERLREHEVPEVAVLELAEVLGERLLRRAPDRLLQRVHFLPERQPPGETRGVQ